MPCAQYRDIELYYQERGHAAPAVFLHGFALDHSMWLDQLRDLAPLRRCLAPDLRGFGRSSVGLDPARVATLHASDVLAFLQGLGGGPVDLIGHSMGGHVAMAVAAAAPGSVRTLTLIGVMAAEEYQFGGPRSREALFAPKEDLARHFAFGMLAPNASLAVRARTLAMAEGVRWEALYPESRHTVPPPPGPLPSPLLLMTGTHDPITPKDSVARFADRLGGTFAVVPDAGHLTPVENPDVVNSLLASLWGM